MIDSHELKRRDSYLNKLIGFQDTEPVKVITGIRRCGKSSLLKLMVQHLKDTGIQPEQIIEMNFESFDFRRMNADDIYRYVKERIVPGKRMYLFFDELQRIEAWEDAINAFRVDFDCDIYVTGSNAYLLSSEYSTYLSGRCVEIKMLPLSFREFLDFHGFEVRETQSALGGLRKQVFDKTVSAMSCEKFSMPICASAACPASLMSDWSKKKHCRFSTVSIPQSWFATFWNGKSAEVKSRSQTLRCCARSFCFLRIISAPVFLLPPSATHWSTKDFWTMANAKAHPVPIPSRHM